MIADIWVAFFHSPQQSLCGQAAAFLEAILRRQPGLQLERWTRLPYVALHNGDAFSIFAAMPASLTREASLFAGTFPPATMFGLTTPWTWLCWRCASLGAQATHDLRPRPRHASASSRSAGRSQRSARRSEGATAFTASWQVRWRTTASTLRGARCSTLARASAQCAGSHTVRAACMRAASLAWQTH